MAKTPTPISAEPAGADPAALASLVAGLEELKALSEERHKATDEKLKELDEAVRKHTETLAADTAKMLDGDLPDGDVRAELLKVHRQLEIVANHLNIRLPG